MVNSEWVTDYAPGEEEDPLDSDVVTWRLAWKLSQARKFNPQEMNEGDMVNLYVVDDSESPIKFYGTGELTILNVYETQ